MEADALTNSEFQDFDPGKRIRKELEEVEFILLHELMQEAAEMNEELKLKDRRRKRRARDQKEKRQAIEEKARQDGKILGEEAPRMRRRTKTKGCYQLD